jgi:hypothetical protein
LVVETWIGPPGAATGSVATVSKKLSSVAGTVAAAVVLTLPSCVGSAGRISLPS